MRFRDIIKESDYVNSLRDEIVTLLTAVSAEGVNEIQTKHLLNDLMAQGYSVDPASLFGVLQDLDIVGSVNNNSITLAPAGPADKSDKEDDGIDYNTVDHMAAKKSMDSLRNDL